MKCPFCGCRRFYVKNPDDEYDIHVFEETPDGIRFAEDCDLPPITEDTAIYCDRCAWSGNRDAAQREKS